MMQENKEEKEEEKMQSHQNNNKQRIEIRFERELELRNYRQLGQENQN